MDTHENQKNLLGFTQTTVGDQGIEPTRYGMEACGPDEAGP
jgi:hypothetical protein